MTNPESTTTHARRVREEQASGLPSLVHPEWVEAFPWVVQGTTTRGGGGAPFDFGLFSSGSPEATVRHNWRRLRDATGATRAVHARQVHGAEVRVHLDAAGSDRPASATDGPTPGLAGPCDGHVTDRPGVLLAVTTADCVPVFVVDPEHRAVAALHAGWRGVAAGVLERGFAVLQDAFGTKPEASHVHMGPSICGRCYEVGTEVFEALDRPVPDGPSPIDLRAVLVERACALGVSIEAVTVSHHCTRCTESELFSHRGGDSGRQVGYVAIRK